MAKKTKAIPGKVNEPRLPPIPGTRKHRDRKNDYIRKEKHPKKGEPIPEQ